MDVITHFCPSGPYRVFVQSHTPEHIRALIMREGLDGTYHDDGLWTTSLRGAQYWRMRLAIVLGLNLEHMENPTFPIQISPDFQSHEFRELVGFRHRYERAGWNEQGEILKEWSAYRKRIEAWVFHWRAQLASAVPRDPESRARYEVAKIAVTRLEDLLEVDRKDIGVWSAARTN